MVPGGYKDRFPIATADRATQLYSNIVFVCLALCSISAKLIMSRLRTTFESLCTTVWWKSNAIAEDFQRSHWCMQLLSIVASRNKAAANDTPTGSLIQASEYVRIQLRSQLRPLQCRHRVIAAALSWLQPCYRRPPKYYYSARTLQHPRQAGF